MPAVGGIKEISGLGAGGDDRVVYALVIVLVPGLTRQIAVDSDRQTVDVDGHALEPVPAQLGPQATTVNLDMGVAQDLSAGLAAWGLQQPRQGRLPGSELIKVAQREASWFRDAERCLWMAPYDLSDTEWRLIEPLLPNKPRGVARVDDRRVINGIFYVLRTGSPWRVCQPLGPPRPIYNR